MTNSSKHIEELLAIDTHWDSTQESTGDEQAVCYSKDGSKVTSIHMLLEDCDIPYGVTMICDYATKIDLEPLLVNVKLPESLVAIGVKAFIVQQSLEDFIIPNSVEIIKERAFDSAKIERLPDDNRIKILEKGAFYCSFLKGNIQLKSAVHIGADAFSYTEISSIELSDSLDTIGDLAFAHCKNIKSISIPKSVKHIGGGFVVGCKNLESIEFLCDNYIIEDGIIYNSDKTELVSSINPEGKVKVPHGVKRICNGAFYGTEITSITIPRSMRSIGDQAFANTKLKQITIPDTVVTLGEKIFSECENLKKIKLPKGLKIIANYTFNECDKITEIYLPESVVEIGEGAFLNCTRLKRINIPSKVTEIADSTFCFSGIRSIVIPDSVTKIGDYAFYDSELKYIELPESIETISNKALKGCNNICVAINKQSAKREMIKSILDCTKINYHSDISINYKIVTKRNNPKVFKNMDYLALGSPEELEIPLGITKVGNRAFEKCENLRSVVIPDTVTEIGEKAFSVCRGLRNIVIPASVSKINSNALSFCDRLDWAVLPEGLKEISSFLFFNCKYLEKIEIPNSVRKIDSYAFAFCWYLTSITIPDGVIRIEDSAFFYCLSLKEVNIPDSVKFIGFGAFGACVSIESITIPRSLEKIEGNIFFMCNVKQINVYEDCPIKDELLSMYGTKVTLLPSDR